MSSMTAVQRDWIDSGLGGHLEPRLERAPSGRVDMADAAGLPVLPGLLRYDEVLSGSVTHAIRMTAESTDTSYL